MSKVKMLSILLVVGLSAASTAEVFAQADANKPSEDKQNFTIRKIDSQVVLYTIYRGDYNNVGPAVGNLFALASKKGLIPAGPVAYVYLNNPACVSNKHWLTEIRIPVGKNALQLAGTLGEMTDVKTLEAMEVAVAVKPEDLADPSAIYDNLGVWIFRQGYVGLDSPFEIFLTNAMGGNYALMKSEIMFPVKKLTGTNKTETTALKGK